MNVCFDDVQRFMFGVFNLICCFKFCWVVMQLKESRACGQHGIRVLPTLAPTWQGGIAQQEKTMTSLVIIKKRIGGA
jgi:hypothetical protein